MSKALAKEFAGAVETILNERDSFIVDVKLPIVVGAQPHKQDFSGGIILSTHANAGASAFHR